LLWFRPSAHGQYGLESEGGFKKKDGYLHYTPVLLIFMERHELGERIPREYGQIALLGKHTKLPALVEKLRSEGRMVNFSLPGDTDENLYL